MFLLDKFSYELIWRDICDERKNQNETVKYRHKLGAGSFNFSESLSFKVFFIFIINYSDNIHTR